MEVKGAERATHTWPFEHTVNGTKASSVTLRDPEMNGNSCFPHQISITNTCPLTGRCSIKN